MARISSTLLAFMFFMIAGVASAEKLRINLGAEPQTIDPALAVDLVGSVVISALMEGLVSVDAEENPQPAVALRWEHSEDYKQWTFHLRNDSRWHNGEPVTANDFVYSIRRVLTPTTGAKYASYAYSFLEGGEEWYKAGGNASGLPFNAVKAIDDHTLVYTLANPTPFFPSVLQLFTWLPVHRGTVERHGDRWALSADTYMGNGPYRLTSYQSGSRANAQLSRTYHGRGGIHWSEVEFHFISSETTANTAFLRGDIDVSLTVPLPEIDNWRDKPEFRLKSVFGTFYVSYNTRQAPFDDARVRRAFSIAINRRLLTTQVTRRNEQVSQGLIPRGYQSARGGDYRDHAGDMIGPRDLDRARQLMRQAGFHEGRGFPRTEYLFETSEQQRMIAEQLQAMWRRAFNVDIRLQNVEWGVLLTRTANHDYQFARLGWYGDYLDPMTFLELFASDNPQNRSGYSSQRFDDLIARARREADPIAREDLLIEAERLLVEEDAAVCPLYTYAVPTLVRKDIVGIDRTMTGSLIWINSRPGGE